jgi:hypothetical protein
MPQSDIERRTDPDPAARVRNDDKEAEARTGIDSMHLVIPGPLTRSGSGTRIR